MNSQMVYLASPIDLLSHPIGSTIREVKDAAPSTWTLFQPHRAWHAGRKIDPRVQKVNEAAVMAADAVLAVWPASVQSRGVPIELGMARARGIPAAIIDPSPFSVHSMSWALATYPVYRFTHEAVDQLQAAILGQQARPVTGLPMAKFTGPAAPSQAYPDDAGYDLTYWDGPAVTLTPGGGHNFDLGVRVQLPPGWWYKIEGRSSMWKRGLMVGQAVIDHGWRGGLFAAVRNVGNAPQQINPGDRLAQLIPMAPTPTFEWVQVDELDPHDRGEQGFGSSGR